MNKSAAPHRSASLHLMKNSRIFLLLPILIYISIVSSDVSAQSVSVQGIITNESGDVTLVGANIVLQKISDQEVILGAASDRNGFYGIGGLEAGLYLLRVSHVGFLTYSDTLNLNTGLRASVNIAMILDQGLLGEVHVAPTGGAIRRGVDGQVIRAIDLDRIPTPAGGGDLASYLQALPGVVSTGDRGGQLFIRGGTPSQNMVLIDGTVIYQPFHIIGFYSAFPQELVSGVDFFPGGFGARYSSRISSVLDVQMRDGNRYKNGGSISVSPFLSELFVEGPIKNGTSSWIASVRKSLIDHTSPWFLKEQQPLRFDSQYLKVSHRGHNNSVCSAMIMRTLDLGRLDFKSDDVFQWSNFVLGGKCISLPESSGSLFELNMGISNMSNSAGDRNNPELTSGLTRFNMDMKVTRFVRNIRLEYGGNVHMKWFNYDLKELFQTPRSDSEVILGTGLHLEATINFGDWIRINPGGLVSLYIDTYKPSFEPRFRLSWYPFRRENEEFTFALGLYRQALVGINDMRDVSSVFVAWMPSPIGNSQLEALHVLTGWKQAVGSNFQLSVEGYYKRLRNLPVTVWSTLARLNTNLALAEGHVYGSDVRMEFTRGKVYGFAGYGYNWTEYKTAQNHFLVWFGEPVQRFHPPHDRRHQFNTMISVALGNYKAAVRWELGSGLPYTQPLGFDELLRLDERLYDVRRTYGNPRVILEKPYQGRLPTYHRMDLSFERKITFTSVQLDLQIGAINLYNQVNLFYYDIYSQRQIDQLPFAPYFSIKLEKL